MDIAGELSPFRIVLKLYFINATHSQQVNFIIPPCLQSPRVKVIFMHFKINTLKKDTFEQSQTAVAAELGVALGVPSDPPVASDQIGIDQTGALLSKSGIGISRLDI